MVDGRPQPLNNVVRTQMARMPTRATKPEIRLRSELHRRGLRFRVNDKRLPGSPDVVLSRAKIAVFVDGCFWHGCPDHYVAPKNNASWWALKLEANRARDRKADEWLGASGWLPVHVWEHIGVDEAADMVEAMWRQRLAGL